MASRGCKIVGILRMVVVVLVAVVVAMESEAVTPCSSEAFLMIVFDASLSPRKPLATCKLLAAWEDAASKEVSRHQKWPPW